MPPKPWCQHAPASLISSFSLHPSVFPKPQSVFHVTSKHLIILFLGHETYTSLSSAWSLGTLSSNWQRTSGHRLSLPIRCSETFHSPNTIYEYYTVVCAAILVRFWDDFDFWISFLHFYNLLTFSEHRRLLYMSLSRTKVNVIDNNCSAVNFKPHFHTSYQVFMFKCRVCLTR